MTERNDGRFVRAASLARIGRFLLARLVGGALAFVLLSAVIFVLARASGDPLILLLPPEATALQIETLRHSLSLDEPLPVQYVSFLRNAAQGDFGQSLRDRRPALRSVVDRLPATASLAVIALTLAVVIAVPLGVAAAYHKDTSIDLVAKTIALLGQSAPAFWLGLVLIQLFSVNWQIFPVAGMGSPAHFVLPAVTLGWFSVAALMRVLRSSMIDVLDSEYVKFLRSQGFSERFILWKHCLRNALIPVLSVSGLLFAIFLTGTVVVETVFAWPGVGRLTYEAIIARDFPVIQAVILFTAGLVFAVNMGIDLLYLAVDPRLRA